MNLKIQDPVETKDSEMELIGIAIGLLMALGVGFFLGSRLSRGHAHGLLQATEGHLKQLLEERADLQNQLTAAKEASAQLRLLERERAEQERQMRLLQEQFKEQFENLASKIFEEKSHQSTGRLQLLLNPLKENLEKFQQEVQAAYSSEARERFALKKEIERIVLVNEQVQIQAQQLTSALTRDVKAQGNWGEIILERILEESGLREGEDYVLQGKELCLKNEAGRSLKPDVIIRLPESKHIIVDSKVSLTHYERYFSEKNEEARPLHLKQFLRSVREHMDDLASKCYQETDGLASPDFVLMFIPIEGAYALAVQQDAQLQIDAWKKRIVLVCPSTLFTTLRTIANVWRLERQNQNTLEIARVGGSLHDKVAMLLTELEKQRQLIAKLDESHEQLTKRLSTGKGSIVRQALRLKNLGAKASKTIQIDLLDDEEEEEEAPTGEPPPILSLDK